MPSVLLWIGNHAFDLLSAVGIISSLTFTAISFRKDTRSRRLGTLLKLTEQHRDIWAERQSNLKLNRIREAQADLDSKPVTSDETQFVMLLIFHLHCWYRAIQDKEVSDLEGLEKDIQNFFTRPVPRRVWDDRKAFFDHEFRQFVDALLIIKSKSTQKVLAKEK